MTNRIFNVTIYRVDDTKSTKSITAKDDVAARTIAVMLDNKGYANNNESPPKVAYCETSLASESDN